MMCGARQQNNGRILVYWYQGYNKKKQWGKRINMISYVHSGAQKSKIT